MAAVICLMLTVTGCTTPVTMLKNDATGQIARCGGDTSSSIAGGLIGYSIQKGSDEDCVRDYQSQGFKRIN
jgi:hypothetical protein